MALAATVAFESRPPAETLTAPVALTCAAEAIPPLKRCSVPPELITGAAARRPSQSVMSLSQVLLLTSFMPVITPFAMAMFESTEPKLP